MSESTQGGDLICRCVSLATQSSASGFIEGERVIAMCVQGGISLTLASTLQEFAFIPLEVDAISLALASVSGSIVSCSGDHFIVHHCKRSSAASAQHDVAAVPLSQLVWTASPKANLPEVTDASISTCSRARTVVIGSVACIKVFRLQGASEGTYDCIRTLYLPRGMRVVRVSMSAGADHVCWFCETSCLVQLMKLPSDDEDSSPADCAPFHFLHHQPVSFVSWLQPPGSGIRSSDIELDDVIISADVSGCILMSKLMRGDGACSLHAVTCARINVSLPS
jgi:hypothetical protein